MCSGGSAEPFPQKTLIDTWSWTSAQSQNLLDPRYHSIAALIAAQGHANAVIVQLDEQGRKGITQYLLAQSPVLLLPVVFYNLIGSTKTGGVTHSVLDSSTINESTWFDKNDGLSTPTKVPLCCNLDSSMLATLPLYVD